MSLENLLISYLRDDQIRSMFARHLTSDIVVEDLSRILLDSIKTADSSDLSLIMVELKKRIPNRDLQMDLMDTLSRVDTPLKFSTQEKVISELESYIRWRKTVTQVNYMASQDLDSIIPVTPKERDSYSKLAEAINFSVNLDDSESTFDFSKEEDHERARIQAIPDGVSLKSKFSFINNALQNSGYSVGELTMFTAPTGVGKSTALAGEGVSFISQGSKVLHYILGDLNARDIEQKYIANSMKKSLKNVMFNLDNLFKLESNRQMFEGVRFRRKDTYDYDVDELCEDVKRMKDKFDFNALIVDYDGSLRPSDKDKGMYEEGGYVYGKIRQLTTKYSCTGLIGCQPKVGSWKSEVIGMESASESSKKQHHIDTMITMSKPDDSVPVGIMNIAKARHGDTGRRNCVCYLTSCASVLEISLDEYNMIKGFYKTGDNADTILRQWARDTKGMDIAV